LTTDNVSGDYKERHEDHNTILSTFPWDQVSVNDITKFKSNAVNVSASTSIFKAIEVMVQNEVSSILVIDESVEEFDEDENDANEEIEGDQANLRINEEFHQYIGVATVYDIATYIGFLKHGANNNVDDVLKFTPIRKVIGVYYQLIDGNMYHNSLCIVNSSYPLKDVFMVLSYGLESIFVRHPSYDNNDILNPLRCINQSDLISYVKMNPSPLSENLLGLSITEAGLLEPIHAYNRMVLMNGQSKVVDCIRKMLNQHGDGLGIVDDNGTLLASIGPEDIMKFSLHKKGLFRILNESIIDVLHEVNNKKIEEPTVINVDEKIGQVLQLLSSEKCPRLFVVDSNHIPIASITRETILAKLRVE